MDSMENSSENSIVNNVQKTASKISEIFASLVDPPKSVWSDSSNRNGTEKNGTSQTTPTKAQPQSQEAFYNRVSTFSPGLWTVHGITPLECARWGWKLLEKDVLQCVSCQEVICAILPNMKDRVAYGRFFGLLKDRLETNHKEACGWLYDPCPVDFIEPLRINTLEELRNMANSAHTLATLNSALPYLNKNRITAILGADEEVIDGLFKNDDVDKDVKTTSVLLVLSGWLKGQGAYLKCNVCRRQVGLWSFYSIADEKRKTNPNKSNPDSSSRKRKLSDQNADNVEDSSDDNRRITRQSPKKVKQSPKTGDAENTQAFRRRTRSSGKEDKKEDSHGETAATDVEVERDVCLLITSPSTQVEKMEKQYFAPLEEHRHWCPWIAVIDDQSCDNDVINSAKDDLPKGFCMVTEQVQALLQVSKQLTSGKKKTVGNVEGLRIIRNVLDEVYCD